MAAGFQGAQVEHLRTTSRIGTVLLSYFTGQSIHRVCLDSRQVEKWRNGLADVAQWLSVDL